MSTKGSHDASYRKLFSHKPMIEDLLRRFARGPWLERLDFRTLEPMPTELVAEDLQQRRDDMIWRLKYRQQPSESTQSKDAWFYVYVMVEFQSSVDRFMALRVLVYMGLLYQHLVRQKELIQGGQLPPLLPIVLCNGERPWKAPRQLADLIADAEGLDRFQLRCEYLLLDEGRIPRQELASLESPVAAMFEIEQSRDPSDLVRVIDKLYKLLVAEELAEVRRDFATWLKRLIVPSRFAEFEFEEISQLEEFRAMIEQRVKEWTKQWQADGYQRGMADGVEVGKKAGIAAGQRDGLAKALESQLKLKFGSLQEVHGLRLQSASYEQLQSWSRQILVAESIEQVFADR